MKHSFLRHITTLLAILFLVPALAAADEKRDSIVVSLITCSPGSEVYELCGHEAIRVRGTKSDSPMDSVWNYGIFNFDAPNFIYRFVKGETDYMVVGYPFSWFMPEYMAAGREVTEQDLNLTQDEAWKLLGMLRHEALPENRTYRYNYVRDNCATRIVERLDTAASQRIIYPDSVSYASWRDEMRAYHANYPWYQFGIDLALGSGIDRRIDGRQEMFVPVEMMKKAAGAHFTDGRPLVTDTRILSPGREGAVLPPTPWLVSPMGAATLFFCMILLLCLWMAWRKKIANIAYTIWYGICGLAGCLLTFLVFVSTHEATSPNILILWLNPLQLIFAVCVWFRKARSASLGMAYYNIVVLGVLLIIWHFQAQSANPAFFLFIGATLALAIAYAVIEPRMIQTVKPTVRTTVRKPAPRKTKSKK